MRRRAGAPKPNLLCAPCHDMMQASYLGWRHNGYALETKGHTATSLFALSALWALQLCLPSGPAARPLSCGAHTSAEAQQAVSAR